MAIVKPYLTSDGIIESVKRKISFPTSQVTFSDDDILKFANEEMFIGQVPSILLYHEEFFVQSQRVLLIDNQTRYTIPNRAIGMKLRDLFWEDTNGNLYDMARINPEEKAWFQRDFNTGRQPYPYYLEGNQVVLASTNLPNPTGNLVFSFFIRPNQLVADENAATITSFYQTITLNSSVMLVGDQLIITPPQPNGLNLNETGQVVFTAVSGAPALDQFQINASSTITATNLAAAINLDGTYTATSVGPIVTLVYKNVNLVFSTSNIPAFTIGTMQGITFSSIPSNITNGAIIDFLQTNPGHSILNYDVTIPLNGISGLNILFNEQNVPGSLIVGDYICLANSAIIPQIPPDLHNVLAERTAARILSSIGDLENLGSVQAKIKEMELNQGMLLDNRIEGRPQKVSNKHSLLRYGKKLIIRRF